MCCDRRYYDSLENAQDSTFTSLFEQAFAKREEAWGNIVTYSRKVFVPLTTMCRDDCGYCVFVQKPGSSKARYMTPDDVLGVARSGEAMGCKEVLFSLGEKPELRYPEAVAALAELGYERTTDYLRDMCELVLRETGLVPHANAGTLSEDELHMLKPVTGSMGMMLETTSRRLTQKGEAHYACPDKVPLQRLRTLERAGQQNVPFTTGILIGIGETWQERVETLQAIQDIHTSYGHIQEVIVQNFRAKPGTAMENHPEPTHEDVMRTLALARLMLDSEISVQAPPNLEEAYEDYLQAGLNDWGGISPVTVDYINPERAWPQLEELARRTEAAGCQLQERLTVYPTYVQGRFLDPVVQRRVEALAREDGLAKVQCLQE